MDAHRLNEESEIVEGPFKFAEASIERIYSVTTECSSKSASRIKLSRWQAALEVGNEEIARDVRFITRSQEAPNIGSSATGSLRRLL